MPQLDRENTQPKSPSTQDKFLRGEAATLREKRAARQSENPIPPPPWGPRDTPLRPTLSPKKDRIYLALLRRSVVALVALCCCGLLRLSGTAAYHQISEGYNELLSKPLPTSTAAWNELLERSGVQSVFGQLEEAVMVFAGRSTQPEEEQSATEPSSQAEPSSQVEPSSQGEDSAGAKDEKGQVLDGQGGWLPWNKQDEEEKAIPAGMTMERPRLTARAATPVAGRLTSAFGFRIHPITGEDDFHTGIDIAAPQGTAIRAAWPGTVTQVGTSPIYGNYILLKHSGGLSTRYCHCDTILAEEGMELRVGERIATVGITGITTGPHLHFELIVQGKCADPLAAFDLP